MNNDYQLQEQHEQQQWKVYAKLQKARVMLQSMPIKKSGFNSFAGFKYFELSDFLPSVNTIFAELELCSVFSIMDGKASLRIIDSELGGAIFFSSPTAEAGAGKAPPIQALGSMHTYLRRYLMLNALEITEHDAVDATIKKDDLKSAKPVTVDVFDSMDDETKDIIENIAMDVRVFLGKNDIAGAVEYITSQEFDADSKTAFWSRLDSKERSAIKKFSIGK